MNPAGRFPANLIHDGSDEVLELFPETKSGKPCGTRKAAHHWQSKEAGTELTGFGDSGSAARFFASCPFDEGDYDAIRYCAKPGKKERNAGLPPGMTNKHETVKPLALMRYLVRLVTPPGWTVLDPFNGSGTTGIACKMEGFKYIGIDRELEYVNISRARIAAWEPEPEEVQAPTLFD